MNVAITMKPEVCVWRHFREFLRRMVATIRVDGDFALSLKVSSHPH
jgi:hypothetical protein